MTEHWFLQGAKAQLAWGPLLAEVDVERPMLGLRNLQLTGEKIDGCLMGVGVRDDHKAQRRDRVEMTYDTRFRVA